MKKQIAAVFMAVCVGFVAVPVSAQPAPPYHHWKKGHRYDHRAYPRQRYDRRAPPRYDRRDRRDRDDKVGAAAAGIIFGAIAGAIASDIQRKNAPPPEYGAYCNYNACANRYRSFRSSDCTFQPYNGPRRYCGL